MQDVLGHLDLSTYPQAALVLFLGAFLAVLVRAVRSDPGEQQRAALLPLEEDPATRREGTSD